MIDEHSTEFFNNRIKVDYSNVKNLSPSEKDKIRHYGSQAEELLRNKNLAMFVHHWRFEVIDTITGIRGHTIDNNHERVALGNELSGMESFVNSLKRAVYLKNKIEKIGNLDEAQ